MLEYWYKERRTLVDFRRGPLGPHFDGFASHLKRLGYMRRTGTAILGKCCLFNDWLIEKGVTKCCEVTEELAEAFLDDYLTDIRTMSPNYDPHDNSRSCLNRLLKYLIEVAAIDPPGPRPEPPTPYSHVLGPFVQYLHDECDLSQNTVRNIRRQVVGFLEDSLETVGPPSDEFLNPDILEKSLKTHLAQSPENLRSLTSTLRKLLRFCAREGYTASDLSGFIPSIPSYRHASLPRGMEDSDLQRMLASVPRDTPKGTRDYAILLLLMAYGVRAKSAAALLLDHINWRNSTIRICAQKGGKEVVLPLLDAVGEAILGYLRYRPDSPCREVFLTVKAPIHPLNSLVISHMTRQYMDGAGVLLPRRGASTLRHSWAIRALAHDASIKTIADVLGHQCLDTTFVYAKADLKALRHVAMPWPEER